MLTSVVVVGAGVAGISAAERLRGLGYSGRLTVVGAEPHLPYDRPPLSKDYLTSPFTEVLLRPESWYAEHDVELRLGVAVDEIRADEGCVALADGSVERADAVLLATGGSPRPLAVPGGAVALPLRTLDDAAALRSRLLPGAAVAVVGAGLVGAEVAASAVALGCQVTLIDPAARPLERAVGPAVADLLHAQHLQHGVRLLTGAVSAVDGPAAAPRLRVGAEVVAADVVVVGVGIDPDVRLAARAGLPVDRGVLVDHAQRTAHPRVFAAGDVARPTGPTGPLPPVEHWDAAVQEGATAAATLLGHPTPAARAPWFWSDRYGARLEVVGDPAAGDRRVVRGEFPGDSFTVVALRDGRCVGAVALNRAADVKALRRLVERGTPLDEHRLATTPDLRHLLRP